MSTELENNTLDGNDAKLPVICRWKFFFEGEEDGWHFFVNAKDYEEAYEIAYDTHGPQVANMMYYNVDTNGI